jgi:hypothetical protein
MKISIDQFEIELDGILKNVERWADRIADWDFLEREPKGTKFHL